MTETAVRMQTFGRYGSTEGGDKAATATTWQGRWIWCGCLIAALSVPAYAQSTAKGRVSAAGKLSDGEIVQVVSEFHRGAALLEQYEYSQAAAAFKSVLEQVPDWVAARFNYGLASFNLDTPAGLQEAVKAYQAVLEADPGNLHALFCLGLYHHHVGESEIALVYFARVHMADPNNPYVAFKYADTLLSTDRTSEGVATLEKVIELDPGFISAIYRLALLYRRERKLDEAKALLQRFSELQKAEVDGGAFLVDKAYGTVGKYYTAMDAQNHPLVRKLPVPDRAIVFSPDVESLAGTTRSWGWDKSRIDLPAVAVADIDLDGDLDLFLAATAEQGHGSLWLNDGSGRFTAGQLIEQRCVTAAFGDVDNDGDDDLWVGGPDGESLWLNDGHGQFAAGQPLGPVAEHAWTSLLRQLDIDSDGDLDLMALRLSAGSVPAGGQEQPAPNSVYNNNRDGSYVDVAEKLGLQLSGSSVVACACDDLDNDRDLDLLLFDAQADKSCLWVNNRMGDFRLRSLDEAGLSCRHVLSVTTGDPDRDGDQDLLVCTRDSLKLFENLGQLRFRLDSEFGRRHGALRAIGGQFVDLDNDGDLDLLLSDAQRLGATRGPSVLVNTWPTPGFANLLESDPGNLLHAIDTGGRASCVAADFNGDGTCDVLIAAMDQSPQLIKNITRGGHWIALDLRGKIGQDKMTRSNNSAIGARVEVKTGNVYQQYLVGSTSGPVALPPCRVHAGLGESPKLDWLRVVWPDGVLQAEVELAGDRLTTVVEHSRKTSSCPYLFAWDGTHFRFVGDFGGVGGLGYLVAPGEYAPPDPTEYVPLPDLAPREGCYELNALTVLEEVTYFDEAKLIAIDHPQGTHVLPNEMMAISVPPPAYELFCFRDPIDPLSARDHRGVDVTAEVTAVDRRYAGATRRDVRFAGIAQPHYVELDFGDQLSRWKPDERLILVAHGWVEYGYSATNYAAAQAGVRAEAPSIFAFRDGAWVELFEEVGYPAGTQHVMTLDLSGKLLSSDRTLRIASNMDLYWDRIYLAAHRNEVRLETREVAAASADLHYYGFPREYSPDGRHPLLSDYENVDPSTTWKLMSGAYTRYGEVAELVQAADDRFVIMGRGDELTLKFPAPAFGPVPPGCQRTFLLKTDSYCKDMDLYTAYPDTVEPLPFHAMSGYPYGDSEHYPDGPEHERYRREYNTRVVP